MRHDKPIDTKNEYLLLKINDFSLKNKRFSSLGYTFMVLSTCNPQNIVIVINSCLDLNSKV